MAQRIRVQNFTVSQDGYWTGEGQTLERPFGHADPGELGTSATNVPMPGNLAEWRVTNTVWLQVFNDRERAGTSMVDVAVGDLDQHHTSLGARGIETDNFITVNKGVHTITFIGNVREQS